MHGGAWVRLHLQYIGIGEGGVGFRSAMSQGQDKSVKQHVSYALIVGGAVAL